METPEAVLEQLVHEAEAAEEPGDMRRASVISTGDDSPPMVASELTSAGWVYIYDRKTGQRSLCNRNMLKQHLEKKWKDGSLVFTTVDPHIKQVRGQFKCLLHPDGPDRAHYDELGLPTCRKSNLTSKFQVQRHMQKRHKQEWATLEAEREERKEQEQRDFQNGLLAKVAGESPLYVSDKPKVGRAKKK